MQRCIGVSKTSCARWVNVQVCLKKTVICEICVYTTKSFMGQVIDLCTIKCRGGVVEGSGGGTVTKESP